MTEALTTARIADAVKRLHGKVEDIREELNAADRVLGDGDTGMTVASVIAAWNLALASDFGSVPAMLKHLGQETRRATGSSLGSVLAIGLIAASKEDGTSLPGMLDAATAAITERSGATAGDKTMLDSLLAVRQAVATGSSALDAAQTALDDFRGREARIGRARIYGAKSVGHDDPGMLAAVLMLRAAQH
jgi:phosphoenolpyruvate---glycerone phosphotransferase subunit DhaL